MCLFVCWFVCFLSATRHLSTMRRCLRVAKSRRAVVAGGPARAGASMHSESTRAHAVQLLNEKNRCADAFQKQNRTRARMLSYVTAEIFTKREKENQHATSQVQFTVCLLLECALFESYESYLIFGRSRPWSARMVYMRIHLLVVMRCCNFP